MRASGFVLIVLGIVALLYGGFSHGRQRAADAASIEATAKEQHDILLSPIVGGISIVLGLVLLVVPQRRSE